MESISRQDSEQGASDASTSAPSGLEVSVNDLWTPPSVHIQSEFPDTVNGWLPFQVPGFNFFTRIPRGLAQWDTGTGKTVLAAGVTQAMQSWADLIIWIVKVGSIENSRRALQDLVGVESVAPLGSKSLRRDGTSKREEQYGKVAVAMGKGECPVLVTNYERLKSDLAYYMALVTGHKIFVVMDEPSEKLRHRDSGTYRAVASTFWKSTNRVGRLEPRPGGERAGEMRILMLDATPIRNHPEGFYNVISLLDPSIYGTPTHFNKTHVTARDRYGRPLAFKGLEEMGNLVAPITQQIDKKNPEIAKQFPKVQDEQVYCDMKDDQEKLYNRLMKEYKAIVKGDESILKHTDLLAAINAFQMLVNNPIMVMYSAHDYEAYRNESIRMLAAGKSSTEVGKWMQAHKKGSEIAWKLWKAVGKNDMLFSDMDTKARCQVYKMLELHKRIAEHDGKSIVFSFYANLGIPRMSYWLERWDIPHVTYTGGMSIKERQAAEDAFRSDPDLRVFLASDAAGTSLNLEMADQVIHYDLPNEWAQLKQRQDRVSRVTSTFERVKFTTLITPGTVEDRKKDLLDRKYNWHTSVMDGQIAENAEYLRDSSELLYVLHQSATL